ncbi:MAG: ornithine carbamoyltransferase [Acidimicrobiia bacterium]
MARHFLSSNDLTAEEQSSVITEAIQLKAGKQSRALEGSAVGMIFEKPSTRTRVSFEVGIAQLGGFPVVLRMDELQLGRGETIEDTARVLSRYLNALVVRTFEQSRLERLASAGSIPVINALSDPEHPCQALADLMTVVERFGDLKEVKFTYLGDGNNVCHSLLIAGAKAGIGQISVASPEGYEPDQSIVRGARAIGSESGTQISVSNDPIEASKEAWVLYTDVWASMGRESEREARIQAFRGFEVSADRVADAAEEVMVMHCLPAHRGEEITDEVMDSDASAVWDQAENRLHTQKALLAFLVQMNA